MTLQKHAFPPESQIVCRSLYALDIWFIFLYKYNESVKPVRSLSASFGLNRFCDSEMIRTTKHWIIWTGHITHIESFGAVSPSVKQKYLRQLRKWKEANEVDIYIYLQSIDPKHVNASCHRQRTSLLHNSGKDIFTKHFLFSVAYTILLANVLYHY